MNGLKLSDSLKCACLTMVMGLTFMALRFFLSDFVALIVMTIAAAHAPLLIWLHTRRQNRRVRVLAREAIDGLLAEIKRSQSVSGEYKFDLEGQARFVIARDRASKLHMELNARFAYLDNCARHRTPCEPGADWSALLVAANRTIELMRNAAYWCYQGVNGVSPELLDPSWMCPFYIHAGGLAALRRQVPERKVVPMSEFELLRRRKAKCGVSGSVVRLSDLRRESQS
ncbi:MAG: hypothetical protein K8F91_01095 [Candidatus Obscuribacterales bacterium]|nr:hypothetical protein [Candidatus Obscuribacterales bacterium]